MNKLKPRLKRNCDAVIRHAESFAMGYARFASHNQPSVESEIHWTRRPIETGACTCQESPRTNPPRRLTALSSHRPADQRLSADCARRIMQTSRIVVGLKDRPSLNDTGISCVQRLRSLLPMALFWPRSSFRLRRFLFAACQNVHGFKGYSPVRALHRC